MEGSHRFAPIFLYFPPRVHLARDRPKYESTVDGLIDFARHFLGALRPGSIPLIFMDLNDGMGDAAQRLDGDDKYCGDKEPAEAHYAGLAMRELLREWALWT